MFIKLVIKERINKYLIKKFLLKNINKDSKELIHPKKTGKWISFKYLNKNKNLLKYNLEFKYLDRVGNQKIKSNIYKKKFLSLFRKLHRKYRNKLKINRLLKSNELNNNSLLFNYNENNKKKKKIIKVKKVYKKKLLNYLTDFNVIKSKIFKLSAIKKNFLKNKPQLLNYFLNILPNCELPLQYNLVNKQWWRQQCSIIGLAYNREKKNYAMLITLFQKNNFNLYFSLFFKLLKNKTERLNKKINCLYLFKETKYINNNIILNNNNNLKFFDFPLINQYSYRLQQLIFSKNWKHYSLEPFGTYNELDFFISNYNAKWYNLVKFESKFFNVNWRMPTNYIMPVNNSIYSIDLLMQLYENKLLGSADKMLKYRRNFFFVNLKIKEIFVNFKLKYEEFTYINIITIYTQFYYKLFNKNMYIFFYLFLIKENNFNFIKLAKLKLLNNVINKVKQITNINLFFKKLTIINLFLMPKKYNYLLKLKNNTFYNFSLTSTIKFNLDILYKNVLNLITWLHFKKFKYIKNYEQKKQYTYIKKQRIKKPMIRYNSTMLYKLNLSRILDKFNRNKQIKNYYKLPTFQHLLDLYKGWEIRYLPNIHKDWVRFRFKYRTKFQNVLRYKKNWDIKEILYNIKKLMIRYQYFYKNIDILYSLYYKNINQNLNYKYWFIKMNNYNRLNFISQWRKRKQTLFNCIWVTRQMKRPLLKWVQYKKNKYQEKLLKKKVHFVGFSTILNYKRVLYIKKAKFISNIKKLYPIILLNLKMNFGFNTAIYFTLNKTFKNKILYFSNLMDCKRKILYFLKFFNFLFFQKTFKLWKSIIKKSKRQKAIENYKRYLIQI